MLTVPLNVTSRTSTRTSDYSWPRKCLFRNQLIIEVSVIALTVAFICFVFTATLRQYDVRNLRLATRM